MSTLRDGGPGQGRANRSTTAVRSDPGAATHPGRGIPASQTRTSSVEYGELGPADAQVVATADLRYPGRDAALEALQSSGVAGLHVKGEPVVARLESAGSVGEPDHGVLVVALDAIDSRNARASVPDR